MLEARSTSPLQDRRFLLLGTLGMGGMAAVYRAYDRIEQRVVALKVLSEREQPGPAHPLSFEFEAWSRLSHPNIVEVYGMSVAERGPLPPRAPYLVLEHVPGSPAHHAFEPGRVDPEVLESFSIEVLRGLAHVHDAGLVHRDLKPANLLVTRPSPQRPSVKITDFGLVARRGASESPGVFSGSVPYVSPEALLGQPLDGRADLYGLGVLLFHLATGEMPVRGGVNQWLRWHLTGDPADPCRVRANLPSRLSRFVRRLTARRADERPGDAGQALELLGAARPTRSRPIRGGKADLARVRLALDAARLGARRSFELPSEPDRTALLREVRVWTEVRGLGFHRFGDAAPRRELAGLVLRLLLTRGPRAARLVDRYGLDRSLPLRLIGGSPVWDHAPDSATLSADAERIGAAGIAGFLLDCAGRRVTIVHVPAAAFEDRLVARVTLLLCRALARKLDEVAPPGGLLLLLDAEVSAGSAPLIPATARGNAGPG